jgi:hypothetical protein
VRYACQVVLHRLSWMLLGANLVGMLLVPSFGLLVTIGWLMFGLAIAERVMYLQRPGARCGRCGKWLFNVHVEVTCKQCGVELEDSHHVPHPMNGAARRRQP